METSPSLESAGMDAMRELIAMMPKFDPAVIRPKILAAYGVSSGTGRSIYDDGPAMPGDWLDDTGTIREAVVAPPKCAYENYYSCLAYSRDRLNATVARVADDAKRLLNEWAADAIVVRGSSGTVFAGALFSHADLPLIVARKDGERSHGSQVESMGGPSRYTRRFIVLDDFVSSGSTVKGLQRDMSPAVCVGVIEYRAAHARTGWAKQPGDGNPLDVPRWVYE